MLAHCNRAVPTGSLGATQPSIVLPLCTSHVVWPRLRTVALQTALGNGAAGCWLLQGEGRSN